MFKLILSIGIEPRTDQVSRPIYLVVGTLMQLISIRDWFNEYLKTLSTVCTGSQKYLTLLMNDYFALMSRVTS